MCFAHTYKTNISTFLLPQLRVCTHHKNSFPSGHKTVKHDKHATNPHTSASALSETHRPKYIEKQSPTKVMILSALSLIYVCLQLYLISFHFVTLSLCMSLLCEASGKMCDLDGERRDASRSIHCSSVPGSWTLFSASLFSLLILSTFTQSNFIYDYTRIVIFLYLSNS
jgi:hypothetical protein